MQARCVSLFAAAAAVGVTSLAWPATADAHATGTVTYQSPVPLWLYVLAGAAAVAASVPAAALADTRIGSRLGRNLYRPRSGRLVRVLQVVATLLLAEIVAAGLFGSEEFAANPATVLVWVDLWVGLGLVAAVFGPVWDLVSPFRLIGDLIDRASPDPPLAYPERLGQWPAVAQLAAFGWMELAWPGGSHPFDLAVVVVIYVLVQVVGMTLVGSAIWLERAELFTAFSRLMARVSPLEWYIVSDLPGRPARVWRGRRVRRVLAPGRPGRARHPLARLHVGDMAGPAAPARRGGDRRRPARPWCSSTGSTRRRDSPT
jgi:hypothetical protein